MMKISVKEVSSQFGAHNSAVSVNNDGIAIINRDGHQLSDSLLNRIETDFEKINALQDTFDIELALAEGNDFLDSRTQAYLYIAENFNSNWSKSPYSESFYDSQDIDWGSKPEDSIRISNHWNFKTGNELHCETVDGELSQGWAVGKYTNGKYTIIKTF